MSHLRAPATRADRREGGRHGRAGGRGHAAVPPGRATPEANIRGQLLRIAVLPAVAVALCGTAAVLFALRSSGARPNPALWAVIATAGVVALAGIAAAFVGAERAAKSVLDRCHGLRRASARGQADLRALVEQLRRGEEPPPRKAPLLTPGGDAFDLLSDELVRAHDMACAAVVQASRFTEGRGSDQKVEVFVNLARRLQSLVHREIQILDELENDVEDPDLLKGLFQVDHLSTRIRRHAENLAVLGGAMSRRQWSRPVTLTEVLRSAIAEVEQYSRVKLVPPIDGTLRGHAVADVIHLLAELAENATVFSAPHTQVLLRVQPVAAGLAVEVEDRGLGMPVTEQNKMNALLSGPDQVDVAGLLQDGRIGLYVVAALARRHGINVRLQTNIYGGTQAVLVLPQELLGTGAADETPAAGTRTVPVPPRPRPVAATNGRSAQHLHPVGAAGPAATAAAAPADDPLTGPLPTAPVTPAAPVVPLPGPAAPAAPAPAAAGAAPLPSRSERAQRPTPAAAVPGAGVPASFRPDLPVLPLAPRTGGGEPAAPAAHDPADRPRLPRRRAQQHLVPQLREAPPERTASEQPAGHDPGLMAAFQRGIGLAEAASALDAEPERPAPAS
ncbi:sensor histidine kinase [Streptomyces sp. NPDC060194]|uniref:sensor histidine kinase n=1 Tax=Streptomyces sp. NPDC060194 TaxID=3347069 RepID=UPI003651BE5E